MSLKNEVWSSKWVFILAAIGAAAGLGNLWRFPYMVYENGGGAFLVAYLLILALFGIPMVIAEVAFGQKMQTDLVGSFGKVSRNIGRFVGWLLIASLILVGGYYASIIAWGFDFLAASPSLAWGNDAEGFFQERILQLTDDSSIFGGFSMPIVFGLIAAYLGVYFSIFKGLKSVGAVVKWTVPLPFILLFILFINALFLPGSSEGFRYFLVPDWSKLAEVGVWKNAISQAFFSANIGFGLTILYASFNKTRQSVVQSGLLVAVGDMIVSLIAGLAMFGTLGWMAVSQNVPISEVVTSGPTLAFVTFPTALGLLPFAAPLMATMFFLAILTLAIDSMFAIVESVSATLRKEFKAIGAMPQHKWIGLLCIGFFGWSLAFAGGNGLYRLDVLDHFVFGHLFFWLVIAQVLLIGWALPAEKLRRYINEVSTYQIGTWFNVLLKYIAPAVFIGVYVWSLPSEFAANYEGYSDNMILWWGWFPLALSVGISWILAVSNRK